MKSLDSTTVGKHRIVVNDGHIVLRDVNVEFDSVDANVERSLERRNRVFGRLAIGTAVGNDLWTPCHRRYSRFRSAFCILHSAFGRVILYWRLGCQFPPSSLPPTP